jgi:hypothetical protein
MLILPAVDVGGTYQLTALLLYVQQLAAAATAAGRRSFWADWLRLLPGLDQGTALFGTWSDAELAGVQFEPYKVCGCVESWFASQVAVGFMLSWLLRSCFSPTRCVNAWVCAAEYMSAIEKQADTPGTVPGA